MGTKEFKGTITLNENYFVTSDSNNWILHYENKREGDDGKVITSTDTWYFSKLSELLQRFMDLRLKESAFANDILIAISNVENEIKQALGE